MSVEAEPGAGLELGACWANPNCGANIIRLNKQSNSREAKITFPFHFMRILSKDFVRFKNGTGRRLDAAACHVLTAVLRSSMLFENRHHFVVLTTIVDDIQLGCPGVRRSLDVPATLRRIWRRSVGIILVPARWLKD